MIYFDNGSTSFPKAPGVGEAMANLLATSAFNINRGGYAGAYRVADMVLDTRELVCRLLDWDDPTSPSPSICSSRGISKRATMWS